MQLASPTLAQDAALTAPMAVSNVPADTELRAGLRALIVSNRLRAPVTGAHLVHKKLTTWEPRPCSIPDHCELHINGVPWVLPPVEHLEPIEGERCAAVAEMIDLNPAFSAVEGYVLVMGADGSADLRPGLWMVADRRSDLIDPFHGHRGVPMGWAYVGIPVLLDIVLGPPRTRDIVRIDELPLRRSVINALRRLNIETLDRLVTLSHRDLHSLNGLGAVAEQEIDAALATLGRYLPAGSAP